MFRPSRPSYAMIRLSRPNFGMFRPSRPNKKCSTLFDNSEMLQFSRPKLVQPICGNDNENFNGYVTSDYAGLAKCTLQTLIYNFICYLHLSSSFASKQNLTEKAFPVRFFTIHLSFWLFVTYVLSVIDLCFG